MLRRLLDVLSLKPLPRVVALVHPVVDVDRWRDATKFVKAVAYFPEVKAHICYTYLMHRGKYTILHLSIVTTILNECV